MMVRAVGLDHSGATYLNEKIVSLDELSKFLREVSPLYPKPAVILETENGRSLRHARQGSGADERAASLRQ
jgi:hypothetical protein